MLNSIGEKILIPIDLDYQIFNFPKSEKYTIVILTSNSLRHKRFAYRLIEEFGDMVIKWYEIDNSHQNSINRTKRLSKIEKIFKKLKRVYSYIKRNGIKSIANRLLTILDDIYYRLFVIKDMSKSFQESEKRIFSDEVNSLSQKIDYKATKITSQELNSQEFIDELKRLNPYFLLTLSGPLYSKEVINSATVAINQHAGYSPDYKGSNTIQWALYHRDINCVASTVHITSSGADDGAILRRSQSTILPNDTIDTIFLRSVALGTELMIEIVKEIIDTNQIKIFPQPKNRGRTYLSKEYKFYIIKSIYRDFRNGWLKKELERRREF